MKQITFQDNTLTLKVGKSPLIIRIILFPTAFLFFILPTYAITSNLSDGSGITLLSVIMIAFFFLLGYYLLRISLWNTFGEEVITLGSEKIIYEADYGWFKGNKKEIFIENLKCSIKPGEFENKDKGVLLLDSDQSQIECVALIPIKELEALIIDLSKILPQKTEPKLTD